MVFWILEKEREKNAIKDKKTLITLVFVKIKVRMISQFHHVGNVYAGVGRNVLEQFPVLRIDVTKIIIIVIVDILVVYQLMYYCCLNSFSELISKSQQNPDHHKGQELKPDLGGSTAALLVLLLGVQEVLSICMC